MFYDPGYKYMHQWEVNLGAEIFPFHPGEGYRALENQFDKSTAFNKSSGI